MDELSLPHPGEELNTSLTVKGTWGVPKGETKELLSMVLNSHVAHKKIILAILFLSKCRLKFKCNYQDLIYIYVYKDLQPSIILK